MKYTTQEVLDQIFGGGGAQFGANENMMLQVGDSRERHDSGRGDSSVEGSLSSVSGGGSITDSINRLHIQKSLSIEDDVFQIGKYVQYLVVIITCLVFYLLLVLCLLCLCARLFICALWSPVGKGLTSWLSLVVSAVNLSLSHWYPGSGEVLDCIDS